ncbi:MAG: hypothetical protein KDA57_18115 [Planctomycetales bacterium]|nr:hypothetical protein [Planctomycetales bacterium]
MNRKHNEMIINALAQLMVADQQMRIVSAESKGCEALLASECLSDIRRARTKLATFHAACENYATRKGKVNANHI